MATLYGNQYQEAYVDVPAGKIDSGDFNGMKQIIFVDFTVTAAPSNNDIIKLAKLPKGARVLDAHLSFPDLGTAGTLELGWAASPELDSDGVTVEAADADGFMASIDVNTAAAIVNMADVSGAAAPGFCKKFSGEVDVQLFVTAAWTATSGTIKGYIEYVLG